MKRLYQALAGLLLFGVFAAACSLQSFKRADLRFRYWGDLEEVKIIEAMLKEFEAAHPGIRVRPERKTPDQTYMDVLLQEFVGGRAPDVIFASSTSFSMLANTHDLLDLRPRLAADPELKEADFYPLMIDSFSRDGKLLALPRDTSPVCVIYYNKALFDAAKLPYPKDSWTWEDFHQAAKALTKGEQWGFAEDFNLAEAWMLSAGGGLVDDYAKPSALITSRPASTDGFLFRWKLQHQDKVMPGASTALNGGNSALFQNGKLGMFLSGLWKVPGFRHITGFEWDVVRLPARKGVSKPRYLSGGSGYAVRASCKDPELAYQLVRFMAGPEGQRRLAATGLAQPALRGIAKSGAFLDDQVPHNKRMLLDAAERGVATPQLDRWTEFNTTIWGPITDPLWMPNTKATEADVKAALKMIDERGNALLFKP